MLDDRALAVLARMEAEEDARARAGAPTAERSLPVGPDSGRFLFALAASIPGCRVLEIGASLGYSTVWLAAGARLAGGRVVSLEQEVSKLDGWRRNLAEAGLGDRAELVEGDALATLPGLEGPFDVVLLDAWKDDYEELFALARPKVRPGGAVVADNVLSHRELRDYVEARRSDPGLSTVTVPLGFGLELSVVLA